MSDSDESLPKLYGRGLPLLVALSFTFTLALGTWFHVMRQPAGGPFSSPLGVVGLAAGVALGQLIATLVARRHRRS